jgi:hypothetical protein
MGKIGTAPINYTPVPAPVCEQPKAATEAKLVCSSPMDPFSCKEVPSSTASIPPKSAHETQICSLFDDTATKTENKTTAHTEEHESPTVTGVLAHDVGVNVAHHAADHAIHAASARIAEKAGVRAAEEAATRAVEHGATRAVEHGAVRAAEHGAVRAAEHATAEIVAHGAGEAAAHGLGRIASVAAPGLGAAAAGYLAYKGVEHSIEAGKKGHVGASLAFALAATVDGTTAVVNGAGAISGAGTLISTPVSIGLGVVATGLSALGAYLDD